MDEEFIESIAPDVLGVLETRGFFEALDDLLAPEDETVQGEECKGGHPRSLAILNDLQFDVEEIDEILQVLHLRGGCCDCEVLYNVSETNRLKRRYWIKRSKEYLANAKPLSEV